MGCCWHPWYSSLSMMMRLNRSLSASVIRHQVSSRIVAQLIVLRAELRWKAVKLTYLRGMSCIFNAVRGVSPSAKMEKYCYVERTLPLVRATQIKSKAGRSKLINQDKRE